MSTAHGNPEEIRALANLIRRIREDVQSSLERGRQAVDGIDWDDMTKSRYQEEHGAAFLSVLTSLNNLDSLPPKLDSVAAQLEEYLHGSR
jgi:hypothetical protein